MNNDLAPFLVNIGNVVLVVGLSLLFGVIIYYMWKVSRAKLTQRELTRAKVLFAITSFIAGVGGIPMLLTTINESASHMLQLFFSTITCVGCLVIWPLFMVWAFVRNIERANLVQKDR